MTSRVLSVAVKYLMLPDNRSQGLIADSFAEPAAKVSAEVTSISLPSSQRVQELCQSTQIPLHTFIHCTAHQDQKLETAHPGAEVRSQLCFLTLVSHTSSTMFARAVSKVVRPATSRGFSSARPALSDSLSVVSP